MVCKWKFSYWFVNKMREHPRMPKKIRRRAITIYRFWVRGWTLKKIAGKYGFTKERARQIKAFVEFKYNQWKGDD